jgi:hypothetical protein
LGVNKTHLVLTLLVLLAVLPVAGCQVGSSTSEASDRGARNGGGNGQAQAYGHPAVKVVVTRGASSLPSGCGPEQAAGFVTASFEALNEGDRKQLPRFFVERSPTPGLFGSSENRGRSGFHTHSRDELMRYFEKRHRHGERMRLLELEAGKGRRPNTLDIVYVATRRADDLKPGVGGPERFVVGKGVIDCKEQRIFVWNMETLQPATTYRQAVSAVGCEDHPGRKPGRSVVACAEES